RGGPRPRPVPTRPTTATCRLPRSPPARAPARGPHGPTARAGGGAAGCPAPPRPWRARRRRRRRLPDEVQVPPGVPLAQRAQRLGAPLEPARRGGGLVGVE